MFYVLITGEYSGDFDAALDTKPAHTFPTNHAQC